MKYYIEGNIDFFSELYKSLDEEENKVETDNNLCLITNQPLIDKYVELNCGHKFNYIPLYNDIYNHKKKFNNMEGSMSLLKVNEIRCPYCRKKQLGVLPYYSELISIKTNGVNFYDNTLSQNNYTNGKCEFIIKSLINFDTTEVFCSNTYVKKLECNNKTYCWKHNKVITKQKEKEEQKKLKEETKQKEKEAQKKLKEEAKEKKKLETISKKINKNPLILSITDIKEENIVVSSLTQTQINATDKGCCQIIKTGLNKGNQCGLIILNDYLCKRHYNIKNKNSVINNIINNNINI